MSASVRALIDAAARVARDPTIVARLTASTGLSRENVEIGLARHLETTVTEAEIDALVSSAGRAESVGVVLSASVFVAPLRAIALALAASDRVVVKPSRREPVFAHALVEALGDPRVTIEARSPMHVARLDVYGRDETIESVRRAAGPRVIVRGHGAGMGVALVTGDFARAAEALAQDVTAFDQRGCLSPRVVWVVGDARAFGRTMFDALESRGRAVPRGALDRAESEELARWSGAVAYAGELHRGASCAVGVLDAPAIPPTGRHLLVRPLASPDALPTALGHVARFVVAVGSDFPGVHAVAPAHARTSPLGAMQRPPLDGPVDRRPA
ncbi:MAG TPA: acyl-CoA reductase [Polyangiaceae bacterium]